MPRNKRNEDEAFGSDSFLDIVANVVGILIILVMIAGLRARQVPDFDAQPTDDQQAELEGLEEEARGMATDMRRVAGELEEIAAIGASRKLERDSLVYLAAEAQQLLNDRRDKLGRQERDTFDLRRQVAERETRLTQLTHNLQDVTATEATAVTIENYPTPISRTVTGHEAHFQLKHGRIVSVPIDEAIELLKDGVRRNLPRLEHVSEVTDTVGPIGDFRLRYTIGKMAVGRGQAVVDLTFEMVPIEEPLGETIEEAMAPRSDFRATLARTNPRHTTITLWAYPDSFAVYRAMKRELYKQGFAIAGRPLPMNQLISGSPHGSKSAAE